ncbi:MAG: thermonuclease family protein [Candidatus Daviesbacteria bacterium]|nr:thermonuclease family protein [Candidatus Daviesbacteria bacterium]
MWSNTKLLVTAGFLIIITGFSLLWFGLKSDPQIQYQSSPIATTSAVVGLAGERVLVTKVVDGDTIEVQGNLSVRFIGIDTPETVDPRRPVGCFGKEASNEVKSLLTNKEIILQKDISDKDKYDRLLRLIFLPLPDGQILFVNDYLVREGFARVLTYPPDVKYNEQLRQAENEAKQFKRGLWGDCN